MKKCLKIFFILAITIFVVLIFSKKVEALETYNSDIEYEENSDGEIVVYSANYNMKDVEIPSMINGKVVTEIGKFGFSSCRKLENISLPNTIKKINIYAFRGCESIKNINIPDSVKIIDSNSFEDCISLRTITGMENVETIWNGAFDGCTSLQSISLPKVKIIRAEVFNKCSNLSEVILSNKLWEICEEAFKDCTSLKSINLPESLTEIDDGVFYNTGLTNITIPSNVTWITQNLFRLYIT